MAFIDITAPSNWGPPFSTYWNGVKYVIPWTSYAVEHAAANFLTIPGYTLKLTIDITLVHQTFDPYVKLSLFFNDCTVDLCRTPTVVGNGRILEVPCYPGISSFYLNPAWCDVSVTKIEMWDGTDPYFWTNFVGETESI